MNIVILDGKTTNPGDLSWRPLKAFGTVTVYDDTPYGFILERAKNAEIVVMNRCAMDGSILRQLPKLRLLATLSTGYNTIDIPAARELGITVCNVPGYCAQTVAQHTFSLLLALCGRVEHYSAQVQQGGWKQAEKESSLSPMAELSGKVLGILGFGEIGRRVARIGYAFGMEILLCSRTQREAPGEYQWAPLKRLFQESDVVSLHCPLTAETRGLVNRERLSLMKPTSLLLNTARGGLIDEQALADALNSGRIAGAGLDVLTSEPPKQDNPLLTARNCLITPHVAWSSREARQRLIETVAENLRLFLLGTPQNVVN